MNPSPEKFARPALRYRGGKARRNVADWIMSFFPPHVCYAEPFMGAASIFLQKQPSDFEVLNDLDGDVVTFFRVLREQPDALKRAIHLTPYARAELRHCQRAATGDDLERARALYVRCWQGRGNSNADSGWRFQREWHGWRMHVGRYFHDCEHLGTLAARLAVAQIDCGDGLDIIRRWDAPATLFYCDPPYALATRPRSPRLYKREWADADHEKFAELLQGIQGMAIVSGYPSVLYERLFAGWRMETFTAYAEAQKQTTEALWISPNAAKAHIQQPLFTE